MATYTKEFFSASSYGRNIKVAATGTPGTTIHTAHATAKDEITINATNTSDSNVQLTIEWGGTTSPDDLLIVTIPGKSGDYQVIAGKILSNSLAVKAFAGTANVINISGWVNRIS